MTSDNGQSQRTRLNAPDWVAAAFASAAAVLCIVAPFVWKFVLSYRLNGDDFPLVLNSSSPYMPSGGWVAWFTQGYSRYFVNYPDWPSGAPTSRGRWSISRSGSKDG